MTFGRRAGDKRRSPRTPTTLNATIILPSAPRLDALSVTCPRPELNSTFRSFLGYPTTSFSNPTPTRAVEVVRRSRSRLGVKFV